ncbi:unnamed protein product, partial [Meganyctiphanes norvegica]
MQLFLTKALGEFKNIKVETLSGKVTRSLHQIKTGNKEEHTLRSNLTNVKYSKMSDEDIDDDNDYDEGSYEENLMDEGDMFDETEYMEKAIQIQPEALLLDDVNVGDFAIVSVTKHPDEKERNCEISLSE